MAFLSCMDVHAVSVRIGDIDGFGYTNVSSLLGFDALPADRNGDGILGAGDVLPDIDQDGDMQLESGEIGDVFDNRLASEKDPSNGARWTDITLSAYAAQIHAQFPDFYTAPGIADDAYFTFTFDVPNPGDADYGRNHYVSFLYADYDVEPMYAVVEGRQVILSGNTSAGTFQDGLIWRAYCEVPWSDMLDGEVTIEIVAPNEPFIAFDYAQLDLSPIPVPPELTTNTGPDMTVYVKDLPNTVIQGRAMYTGSSPISYRWYSGQTPLLGWTPVGQNMTCNLTIPQGAPIPAGTFILTLEVTDGVKSASDTMVFTILPNPVIQISAEAGTNITVYSNDLYGTTMTGKAQYNGSGPLTYRWYSGQTQLLGWTPVSQNMDCILTIPQGAQIPAGIYTLTLEVTDGVISASDTMVITILPVIQISADAGTNITVYSENLYGTTMYGTAQYSGSRPLTYRWLSGQIQLLGWTPVSQNMDCILTVPQGAQIPPGTYTLTLEVTDGVISASDNMIFTLNNTAPHAAILGGGGTYEYGADVLLIGEASDFDGDALSYEWKADSQTICTGTVQSIFAGSPVQVPYCMASSLTLGQHALTLSVSDGINSPVSAQTILNVIDSTAPTLAPFADTGILWPPDHKMVTISIAANAFDSSGMPVTLSATVRSNEPEDGLGDGDMSPDWTTPVIDQQTGIITLQLRSERSGAGVGRTYTVTIYATDAAGNQSSATIQIIVPHDKGQS